MSIMSTKLTLTMDKAVIEMAKKYAKEQGRSLSDIVENYFKMISNPYSMDQNKSEVAEEEISFIRKLSGSLKAPKDYDFNYNRDIQEERIKRYLKK